MIIGVVAIASVLAAYFLFGGGRVDADTANEMTEIASMIESDYAGTSSYNGLTTTSLLAGNSIPARWRSADGNYIVTPLGGNIAFIPINNGEAFLMGIYNLNERSCLSLVSTHVAPDEFEVAVTPTTGGYQTLYAGSASPAQAAVLCPVGSGPFAINWVIGQG